MLIDGTYFVGPLSIGLSPDTGASSVTQMAEREKIDSFICLYEKEYLEKMLGKEVCSDFTSYCDSGKDDDEYFNRLKSRLTERYSPIAGYVYFKFVSVGNYHVTNVGTVKSAGDDMRSPDPLLIRAWNDMVRCNRDISSEFLLEPCREMIEYINVFGI